MFLFFSLRSRAVGKLSLSQRMIIMYFNNMHVCLWPLLLLKKEEWTTYACTRVGVFEYVCVSTIHQLACEVACLQNQPGDSAGRDKGDGRLLVNSLR